MAFNQVTSGVQAGCLSQLGRKCKVVHRTKQHGAHVQVKPKVCPLCDKPFTDEQPAMGVYEWSDTATTVRPVVYVHEGCLWDRLLVLGTKQDTATP